MKYSGSKLIPLGMLLMGMAFTGFAVLPALDGYPIAVILWACLCRVMHGIASSTMQTTAYAVGTNDFPERKELIVGGIEAMTGVGNIAGPLLSSLLYEKFGFGLAFAAIGLGIVASSMFFLCYFPKV
jgi:MFS family permease